MKKCHGSLRLFEISFTFRCLHRKLGSVAQPCVTSHMLYGRIFKSHCTCKYKLSVCVDEMAKITIICMRLR